MLPSLSSFLRSSRMRWERRTEVKLNRPDIQKSAEKDLRNQILGIDLRERSPLGHELHHAALAVSRDEVEVQMEHLAASSGGCNRMWKSTPSSSACVRSTSLERSAEPPCPDAQDNCANADGAECTCKDAPGITWEPYVVLNRLHRSTLMFCASSHCLRRGRQ